jgi:hypothetical protein
LGPIVHQSLVCLRGDVTENLEGFVYRGRVRHGERQGGERKKMDRKKEREGRDREAERKCQQMVICDDEAETIESVKWEGETAVATEDSTGLCG